MLLTATKAVAHVADCQGCDQCCWLSAVAVTHVAGVVCHVQKEQAEAAREKFMSSEGDHVTLLNIFRAYKTAGGNKVRACWCCYGWATRLGAIQCTFLLM